jgi:hypothetical protein
MLHDRPAPFQLIPHQPALKPKDPAWSGLAVNANQVVTSTD